MKVIKTNEAPLPIGPYSQAILTDDVLFISGCLGIDPKTNELKEDLQSQTRQALDNMLSILKEAKFDINNVVKTTVYLTKMSYFAEFNKIYAEYFKDSYPARTCVEISALPKGGLLEIEAIASKKWFMFKIIKKEVLNPTVTKMVIEAPLVAKKAKAGQFIILRVSKEGERIPLTVADYDREKGTVTIIFQIVGATTYILNQKEEGDYIEDFVGPLGVPTKVDGLKKVCVVGGGVGCAIALPVARALKEKGCEVVSIIGFRNKDLLILEDEFRQASSELIVMSDDGSYGRKGNVTLPLKELLENHIEFDKVITIGPLIMMKYVVLTCKEYGMPCDVSMNPIMIDGTGMCGGCRLSLNIDGKKVTKFACVDGPDFDGYEVDFDEAMARNRMYSSFEKHKYDAACNLFKEVK